MNKTKTIGNVVDKKVKDYFEIYLSMLSRSEFKSDAESIALHDLIVEKLISEMAIDKLKAKIREHKAKGGQQ